MDSSLGVGGFDTPIDNDSNQQQRQHDSQQEKRRPKVSKTHRVGEVPDFSTTGISPRLLGIRVKPCGLCQVEFDERCFGGIVSRKAVTELRAKWGRGDLRERDVRPSNLYAPCHVCVFCAQFFGIERFDEAAIAGEASENASPFSQRAVNQRVRMNRKRDVALEQQLAKLEAEEAHEREQSTQHISSNEDPPQHSHQRDPSPPNKRSHSLRPQSAKITRSKEQDVSTRLPSPPASPDPKKFSSWRVPPPEDPEAMRKANTDRFSRTESVVARMRRGGPHSRFATEREEKDFFKILLRRVAIKTSQEGREEYRSKHLSTGAAATQEQRKDHTTPAKVHPQHHEHNNRAKTPSLTQELRVMEERHRKKTTKLLRERLERQEQQLPPTVLIDQVQAVMQRRGKKKKV